MELPDSERHTWSYEEVRAEDGGRGRPAAPRRFPRKMQMRTALAQLL